MEGRVKKLEEDVERLKDQVLLLAGMDVVLGMLILWAATS